MTIQPIREGHVLLIPRAEIDHWDHVPEATAQHLMRVAQRITSLIALLPTALGANGGLKIEGEPRIVGKDARHLQVVLRQGPTKVRAIAFRMADRLEELQSGGGDLSIAFRPNINEFGGRSEVQVQIEDFQPRSNPDVEFVPAEKYWKDE
jgi:hypothetical protein